MQTTTISVNQDVLARKKKLAAEQRDLFTRQGTFVVNLVSSPGAGKTSLLQATAQHWGSRFRMGVLVGDLATDRDAARLRPYVPVEQLTTGGACHLELALVQQGLHRLPQAAYDFLAHPSCLEIEDPKFETIKLICDMVRDAGNKAAIVGLDAIAKRAQAV